MTVIRLQDGKAIVEDGKVGISEECCCEGCSGPCDDSEDCAPGCECVDGECEEKQCAAAGGGNGWYTASEEAVFTAFLQAAGYVNITFTEVQAFGDDGPFPYEGPCEQVFYRVDYQCCGIFGGTSGCDPLFITEVQTTQIGGNQQPPCNTTTFENFLFVCCEEEPPP